MWFGSQLGHHDWPFVLAMSIPMLWVSRKTRLTFSHYSITCVTGHQSYHDVVRFLSTVCIWRCHYMEMLSAFLVDFWCFFMLTGKICWINNHTAVDLRSPAMALMWRHCDVFHTICLIFDNDITSLVLLGRIPQQQKTQWVACLMVVTPHFCCEMCFV